MNKPLLLFVGKSASGKTTIANMLENEFGYKQLESFTTRPPRYEGEKGHIFISEDEFNNLGDLVAYTFYNGYHYGTTSEEVDKCDIYVIDVPGVEMLLQKYSNKERKICVLYFNSSIRTRIDRMIDRGSSDTEIVGRLYHDEQGDWFNQLYKAIYGNGNRIGWFNKTRLYLVDANKTQEEVYNQVKNFIAEVNE